MADNSGFENTPLWLEVKDIIDKSKGVYIFDCKGTIHTVDSTIGVIDLNYIEGAADFVNQIGDVLRIEFKLGLGEYVKRLYPRRNNLEFTLTKIPLKEGFSGKKKNEDTVVIRYKAVFNPSMNPPVGGSDLEQVDIEDLNKLDIVTVRLELLHRSLEPLRIKTEEGTFQNTTVKALTQGLLMKGANEVLVDGKPALEAIDIIEPENTGNNSLVIIPHGTRYMSVPSSIQQNIGIYNFGIGTFFQVYRKLKTLFVYPLYNHDRFDQDCYKAIFYSVPQNKLPMLDKSFIEEGKVLKVACTAQKLYSDSADIDMANGGSGLRSADARAFMKKPVLITDKGAVGDRARLNNELIHSERDDGLNYAPVLRNGPTSNMLFERSKVITMAQGQIDLIWENGNADLLYPGMPCKYVFLNQGKVIELKCTLLFVHSFSTKMEKYGATGFRTTIRVSLASERKKDIPNIEPAEVLGEK